ncbi:MAG: hypothetical protein M3032_13140 [Verrucomicrobiota bacterium]|nr:hypothetical protein [Verrucomicrobiota bacterium]
MIKLSLCRIGLLVFSCTIAVSDLHAAGSARENERLQSGKITRNEAQHIVLKKYPGAEIKKCELKHGKEHSYFAVELRQSGSKSDTKLQVDGRTGQISR